MKSARFWVAYFLLRLVRWYFVGRSATCISYDFDGFSEEINGKFTGGRIALPDEPLTLIWTPNSGDIMDVMEVPVRELSTNQGRWEFFDNRPLTGQHQ